MVPIERLITPKLSSDVIKMLYRRGWTPARVRRTINASAEFLGRVEDAVQSLSERDLTIIARAERTNPLRVLFDAMEPAAINSDQRELYQATRKLVRQAESSATSAKRSSRKRRGHKHAA